MCRVDDVGVDGFRCLNNLQSLNLAYTYVTDWGVRVLRALSQLTFLSIDSRVITDAGLTNLPELGRLQALDLFGCKVCFLSSLARLRWIMHVP